MWPKLYHIENPISFVDHVRIAFSGAGVVNNNKCILPPWALGSFMGTNYF
jgi:hypothetical protein